MFTSSTDYWIDNWRIVVSVLAFGLVICVVNSILLVTISAYLQRIVPITITWATCFCCSAGWATICLSRDRRRISGGCSTRGATCGWSGQLCFGSLPPRDRRASWPGGRWQFWHRSAPCRWWRWCTACGPWTWSNRSAAADCHEDRQRSSRSCLETRAMRSVAAATYAAHVRSRYSRREKITIGQQQARPRRCRPGPRWRSRPTAARTTAGRAAASPRSRRRRTSSNGRSS